MYARVEGSDVDSLDCMEETADPDTDVDALPDGPGMSVVGGRGASYGPDTYRWHETTYWVWPLPTEDVSFWAAWPAFDLEGRRTFPATLFADAASRARPVWEQRSSPNTDAKSARRKPPL